METKNSRCTAGCTRKREIANGPLEAIAAAVKTLSAGDRAQLAAMLAGQGDGIKGTP